jgi:tagaturonate reductase
VQSINRPINTLIRNQYPVKILQFGSGNFLRGFADWMVQVANEKTGFNAGISVVQDISNANTLHQQEGVYTVILKGIREEEFINRQYKIDIIQRVVNPNDDFESFLNEALNPDLQFIISNTPEAEGAFNGKDALVSSVASTFAGKLTQLLFNRFKNKLDTSLLILPTEPYEENGTMLKANVQKYCTHWQLSSDFSVWLSTRVTFCNTLVDRTISGFPQKSRENMFAELGYADELIVEGEWFHLWVIEGPRWMEEVLPLKKAGLNVIYTNDLAPYHLRKVRILNGAHTCLAYVGLLAGLQTVHESIDHPVVGRYIKRMIYDDIVPGIPADILELEKYAGEVIDRFRNPAMDHQLVSMSVDSFSKFRKYVLPSLLEQVNKSGVANDRFAYSLAALIFYYHPLHETIRESGNETADFISFMRNVWEDRDYSIKGMEERCRKVLGSIKWWGMDLTNVPHLVKRTSQFLHSIEKTGLVESLREL